MYRSFETHFKMFNFVLIIFPCVWILKWGWLLTSEAHRGYEKFNLLILAAFTLVYIYPLIHWVVHLKLVPYMCKLYLNKEFKNQNDLKYCDFIVIWWKLDLKLFFFSNMNIFCHKLPLSTALAVFPTFWYFVLSCSFKIFSIFPYEFFIDPWGTQ